MSHPPARAAAGHRPARWPARPARPVGSRPRATMVRRRARRSRRSGLSKPMPSAEVATRAFDARWRARILQAFAVPGSVRPVAGRHPMTGAQGVGDILGTPRSRIHDAAPRQVAKMREQPAQPLLRRHRAQHAEPQRVPARPPRIVVTGAPPRTTAPSTSATTRAFAVAVVARTGVSAGRPSSRS